MFGDEKLAGMFKQKIDSDGELYFRGVMHFYGSKLPVSIELRPTNKAIKGERVYLAYSFLPPRWVTRETMMSVWNLLTSLFRLKAWEAYSYFIHLTTTSVINSYNFSFSKGKRYHSVQCIV